MNDDPSPKDEARQEIAELFAAHNFRLPVLQPGECWIDPDWVEELYGGVWPENAINRPRRRTA